MKKKKKIKNIIIIIYLAFIIYGCKDIQCPGYPEKVNYFPYEKEQEIKFTNTQNEVNSFIIFNTQKTDPFSFSWNCKCVCGASSFFSTYENNDSLRIDASCDIVGERKDLCSSLDLRFDFIYSYHYKDYFFKTINIGKKVPFDEIYKYINDTIYLENENNINFKKLVLVRNKGIVSYTTSDGEVWILVN